jgi:sterol desaturase/sphingolipid hydroxylase (fatty acid hydroxylase superfamily)
MTVVGQWLADGASHTPLTQVAAATILWFAAIYTVIAGGAFIFGVDRGGYLPGVRAGQVRRELALSAASLLVFAAQATLLVSMLRWGWLAVAWDRPVWSLLWEMPALYIWNELHFFLVHRALHLGPLYRRVHVWHHRSVTTTPFSAYSSIPSSRSCWAASCRWPWCSTPSARGRCSA